MSDGNVALAVEVLHIVLTTIPVVVGMRLVQVIC